MKAIGAAAFLLCCGAASAQNLADGFADAKDGGRVHVSGFVCPPKIGMFERDAVGEKDSTSNAGFCAYSERDGVYGTVTLTLLKGPYDPKASLGPNFVVQEGIGARRVAETTVKDPVSAIGIYTRTYETSKLESLHYKMLFTGAAVGSWAVETTIEYADPRDNAAQKEFFDTIYAAALKQIAKTPQAPVNPAPVQTP
jgi:hypothetical protein